MAKPDISQLRPPAYVEETRTFTDPANPGVEIPLTFRLRKDVSRDLAQAEQVQRLVTDFVTGRDGGRPGIFKVGPDRVVMTEDLISAAVSLSLAEYCEMPDKPYSAEDWIGFSVTMPTMFEEAYVWFDGLRRQVQEQAKNA